MLPKYLETYAKGGMPSLHKIVLLWNNVGEEVPLELKESLSKYETPIVIEERGKNSLNQRFYPSSHIETEAVFAMDDDMMFAPQDVENAYQAWKSFGLGRKRMVGFVPRDILNDGKYDPFIHHDYK